MKKTLLTTAILLAFTFGGEAQTPYYPLVQEGNNRQQWNVLYIGVNSNYPNDYFTEVQSIRDNINLDGVTYKLVWVESKYARVVPGAVREEDRRVYFRKREAMNSNNYEDEVLLYDFNLTVGDTVTVNGLPSPLMVLEESEVEVDGVMRRQLGLGDPNNGVSPFNEVDEYWIEGVGSTHGLLNSGYEPWSWFGSFDHLLCYHEDGILVWDNEEFDSCVMNSDEEPFVVGNLLYKIIGDNPPRVSVVGHVDGTAAQGELVIPETVEYEGVTYTVTSIGRNAFHYCQGLTGDLIIPNTVAEICIQSFSYCTGFTGDLVIPNTITELGTDNLPGGATFDGAFEGCRGFTHLVLGESLETIGCLCFRGCSGFTGALELPSGLKEIWECAFEDCSGFTGELFLPDSLTNIGGAAFAGCGGFTGVLTIPESIESIGSEAFLGCRGIETITLPQHYILNDATRVFAYCTGLIAVEIPEGWANTGSGTFQNCSDLVSVHLPESLLFIGGRAFQNCSSLSEINVPEGVKEIRVEAFMNCASLTEFVFPENLTQIDASAFSHCVSLSGDLIIPDYLERMEPYAFDSCVGFNRLVMGAHVNYIAEPAFENTEFELIIIKAMVPPVLQRKPNQNAWHFPVDIPIMVPCGTLEAYQSAEGWSEFTNITEDCGGLPAFNGSEWYYEILNENGSITYQHLEYVADTTVNHKDVQIIIRTNTLYDKGRSTEVTREYVYEEDNKVYWWNKDLQEFTVLYDLGALQGDEWEIKVGMESLTMHVDAVDQYYYDGRLYKLLQVSDKGDLFSGTIVCGIGHLTSFFPERLMTRGKNYRVEGIRCYWREGELVFKYGDKDCDEVYEELHNGIDEDGPSTGSGTLTVYPNPTHNVLFVETRFIASQPSPTYHIDNMMGQTLMSGNISAENQQIDVSNLPDGMYFITVGDAMRKFVLR